ncbi:hypothetical protein RchiOBHm_Chr2g0168841 [Rosa chinensis]|uniref:Uncharacterized protein n=1 Tax=Rosa chinensis TaxID=74649 RepID=A0A2P6S4N6_ROSCH|nr:hypothetical protein RchiOBHm_Chr2g0168841 [Rosa chinensis]
MRNRLLDGKIGMFLGVVIKNPASFAFVSTSIHLVNYNYLYNLYLLSKFSKSNPIKTYKIGKTNRWMRELKYFMRIGKNSANFVIVLTSINSVNRIYLYNHIFVNYIIQRATPSRHKKLGKLIFG